MRDREGHLGTYEHLGEMLDALTEPDTANSASTGQPEFRGGCSRHPLSGRSGRLRGTRGRSGRTTIDLICAPQLMTTEERLAAQNGAVRVIPPLADDEAWWRLGHIGGSRENGMPDRGCTGRSLAGDDDP